MSEDNVVPLTDAKSALTPEELKAQIGQASLEQKRKTVQALVMIHSLLADGLFPGKLSGVLHDARGFIEHTHAQALHMYQTDPNYKPENAEETPVKN